jgi:hypothetical protein
MCFKYRPFAIYWADSTKFTVGKRWTTCYKASFLVVSSQQDGTLRPRTLSH